MPELIPVHMGFNMFVDELGFYVSFRRTKAAKNINTQKAQANAMSQARGLIQGSLVVATQLSFPLIDCKKIFDGSCKQVKGAETQ